MTNAKLDTKRILIFLGFACGIAWAVCLIIYLTGGLVDSPLLIPGSGAQFRGITLAQALTVTLYMWAPALAHVLTRLVTREGWQNTYLRPHFKQGWRYWLIAFFVPALLNILGALVFFVIFPRYFDPSAGRVREALTQAGQTLPVEPWMLALAQAVQAILFAPLINSLFTFGEEFGWRAYLQPKLMPLGGRKTVVIMGLIWGLWHWPLVMMGYNYGLLTPDYFGAPWTGILVMTWVIFLYGTFLGWLALRGRSVWPAMIGHAAILASGGSALLFSQGEPSLLLGPSATGLIAALPWALVALWIFLSRKALTTPTSEAQSRE